MMEGSIKSGRGIQPADATATGQTGTVLPLEPMEVSDETDHRPSARCSSSGSRSTDERCFSRRSKRERAERKDRPLRPRRLPASMPPMWRGRLRLDLAAGSRWAHGRTDAAIRASQPPPPSPDGGARRALAWLKAVADGQIAPARRSGGSWRARRSAASFCQPRLTCLCVKDGW